MGRNYFKSNLKKMSNSQVTEEVASPKDINKVQNVRKEESSADKIESMIQNLINDTNQKRQAHSDSLAVMEAEIAEMIVRSSKTTFENSIAQSSESLKKKIEEIFTEINLIRSLEDKISKIKIRMKKAYELMFCEE